MNTTRLYDARANQWTVGAPMSALRRRAASCLLADGTVPVADGQYG